MAQPIRAAVLAMTALTACGGADDESAGPNESAGGDIATHQYSGPGSFYRAVVDDAGGFTIEVSDAFDQPVQMTIGGQYTRLPSGFLDLDVQTVSSSIAGAPAPGDRAVALELPGFALFLSPAGSTDVIPMLVMDACPTQNFDANWIMVRGEAGRDATHPDREWFGTFAYEHGTTPVSRIPNRYNLSNLSPLLDAPSAIEAVGCQMGHLPVYEAGRLTANMWLTDGGAIVESIPPDGNKQALVAMRRRPVTVAEIAGQYAALFVGTTVTAGTVTFDGTGTGTGALLSDPADLSTVSSTVQFSLAANAQLGTGWLSGTIQSAGTGNLACSALVGAGATQRTVLVCIGQDPAAPSTPISVLMASTPVP